MPTHRLDLAYDGTHFHGYARQPDVRTVQGELEEALSKHTGPVETSVAGRTDAGVHARHQVVSFSTPARLDLARLHKSLNSQLAPEIAVRSVAVAPDGFDARFSATARAYRYVVDNAPVADPRQRLYAWHVPYDLDVDAMGAAAGHFVGLHDFASLCRAAEGRTTERTVTSATWRRDGARLVYDVQARAFCHQMVRSMGALGVEVGRGRLAPGAVPEILAACDRAAARGAAPAHGLALWSVSYEEGGG